LQVKLVDPTSLAYADVSDTFNSFDGSFAALFSSINGDALYDIWNPLADEYSAFVVRPFQYSLVIIGAYAIISTCVAIFQHAYGQAKEIAKSSTSQSELLLNSPFVNASSEADLNIDDSMWNEMLPVRTESHVHSPCHDISDDARTSSVSTNSASSQQHSIEQVHLRSFVTETRKHLAAVEIHLQKIESMLSDHVLIRNEVELL